MVYLSVGRVVCLFQFLSGLPLSRWVVCPVSAVRLTLWAVAASVVPHFLISVVYHFKEIFFSAPLRINSC